VSDRVDVAVQGGELATFRLGARRADAPRVLAIHGITSTSRSWLATGRALGERAALIAVDLRGRGRSNALPPPFGLDAHVRDMIAVLDHLGLERATIAGHSLGAYIAARVATTHPERVEQLVLVDGGLTIPESQAAADREKFIEEFLSATLARLKMTFPDLPAYVAWWRDHPAIAGSDVDPAVLEEYAAHDLEGEPPQMHSSINHQIVHDDGLDLFTTPDADRLTVPAMLLCAPKGMIDDPRPMQPLAIVETWAAADRERRLVAQVPGVNHYTIALGEHGARAVAAAIADLIADQARFGR
jgi:pimeloyl-ACP methyl ester carboxylesterase